MEFHSILKKQLFPIIIWERFHDGLHRKQKKMQTPEVSVFGVILVLIFPHLD